MVERLSTGIKELDDLLTGGLPQSTNIVLKGPPGSLKTILCLQMLYNAAKDGVPGQYITLSQSIEGIKEQAAQFGWIFDNLPVQFVSIDISSDADVDADFVNAVKNSNAKLIVVDSLTSLLSKPPITRAGYQTDPMFEAIRKFPGLGISDDALLRAMATRLFRRVSGVKATILFIYEENTLDGLRVICEYLSDGIIKMAVVETIGKRTMTIEKMRYTRHDLHPRTISVKEKGLVFEK